MNHSEVNYYTKEKITVLKQKIRQNEIAAKIRVYKQTNGVPARNNDIDVLHFNPQLLLTKEWGDAYQVI